MDTPYSNRELDEKFNDIKQQLDRIEADGKETKEQVLYTNGKVRGLQIWRAYTVGFGACISVLILPIMFILLAHYFPQV